LEPREEGQRQRGVEPTIRSGKQKKKTTGGKRERRKGEGKGSGPTGDIHDRTKVTQQGKARRENPVLKIEGQKEKNHKRNC